MVFLLIPGAALTAFIVGLAEWSHAAVQNRFRQGRPASAEDRQEARELIEEMRIW